MLVLGERAYRRGEVVVDRPDKRQVEIDIGERGIHLRRQFVVQLRQAKIIRVEIQIAEIVVRFEMTRVVFQ